MTYFPFALVMASFVPGIAGGANVALPVVLVWLYFLWVGTPFLSLVFSLAQRPIRADRVAVLLAGLVGTTIGLLPMAWIPNEENIIWFVMVFGSCMIVCGVHVVILLITHLRVLTGWGTRSN